MEMPRWSQDGHKVVALSQGGYKVVALSQGGHKVVALSQGWSIVTRLQACYHLVQPRLSQDCHKVVTRVITLSQGCFNHEWLQLTITTSTCRTKAVLVYVLHSY